MNPPFYWVDRSWWTLLRMPQLRRPPADHDDKIYREEMAGSLCNVLPTQPLPRDADEDPINRLMITDPQVGYRVRIDAPPS